VTYRCQYFTINSNISQWDPQCETLNAEPEIGTDRSSQTRRNPQVDQSGTGFGLQRVSRSGFQTRLQPNRPVFAVQIRTASSLPGPVANTTSNALKSLIISSGCFPSWRFWGPMNLGFAYDWELRGAGRSAPDGRNLQAAALFSRR